jgi:hypothetical protein
MSALRDSLAELFVFLTKEGIEVPTRHVWILELDSSADVDERGRPRVSRSDLRDPVAYEVRFDELLAAGPPWINISCWGVDGERLVVAVETPRKTGLPSSTTSINYSGPTTATQERGWDVGEVLALK